MEDSLWKLENKLVVDDEGHPIICKKCPCLSGQLSGIIEVEFTCKRPARIYIDGDIKNEYVYKTNQPIIGTWSQTSLEDLSSAIVNRDPYFYHWLGDNLMRANISGNYDIKTTKFEKYGSVLDPYCSHVSSMVQTQVMSFESTYFIVAKLTSFDTEEVEFAPSSFFPLGVPSLGLPYKWYESPMSRYQYEIPGESFYEYGYSNDCLPSGSIQYLYNINDEISPDLVLNHFIPIAISGTNGYQWAHDPEEPDEWWEESCTWGEDEWNWDINRWGENTNCLAFYASGGINYSERLKIVLDQYESNFTIRDEEDHWIAPSGQAIVRWHSEGNTFLDCAREQGYRRDEGKLLSNYEFYFKLTARPIPGFYIVDPENTGGDEEEEEDEGDDNP